MQGIIRTMHNVTGALLLETTGSDAPRVLDLCMAPGGYLAVVLKRNPRTQVMAFTLPKDEGGHEVLVPLNDEAKVHYLDITMLAADMDVTDIPTDHPDAKKFLLERFLDVPAFDLVICDGMVRRTQERAEYRALRRSTARTTIVVLYGRKEYRASSC